MKELGEYIRVWWADGYTDLDISETLHLQQTETLEGADFRTYKTAAGGDIRIRRTAIAGWKVSTPPIRAAEQEWRDLFPDQQPQSEGKEPWEPD